MRIACSLLASAVLAAVSSSQAQLFKCVGADGKTTYQGEPCPTTVKEERIKVQTGPMSSGSGEAIPGAEPGTPGGAMSGWDKREIIFMADTCSRGILEPARADFDSRSLPLPPKLQANVDAHCNCMANKASMSYTFLAYTKNPVGIALQLQQEAYRGGTDCTPQGDLADLLRKAGKMK